MFSFNVSANNTNAKLARVISPVAYGGTPWSRRALATGNGVGAVQVSSPSGVSKLNLPITNIIECKINWFVSWLMPSIQLKSSRVFTHPHMRESEVFTTVMGPVMLDPAVNSAQQKFAIVAHIQERKGLALSSHLFDH